MQLRFALNKQEQVLFQTDKNCITLLKQQQTNQDFVFKKKILKYGRKRALEEKEFIKSCKHANIVQVFEISFKKCAQFQYMETRMEYCQDGTFDDIIGNPAHTHQARLAYILQVCSAITFLHRSKQRPHGHLKPENILIHKQLAKLTSIQYVPDSQMDSTSNDLNVNSYYQPPTFFKRNEKEQKQMQNEDRKRLTKCQEDIWSLGLILLQSQIGDRLINIIPSQLPPALLPTFPNRNLLRKVKSRRVRKLLQEMLTDASETRITIEQVRDRLQQIQRNSEEMQEINEYDSSPEDIPKKGNWISLPLFENQKEFNLSKEEKATQTFESIKRIMEDTFFIIQVAWDLDFQELKISVKSKKNRNIQFESSFIFQQLPLPIKKEYLCISSFAESLIQYGYIFKVESTGWISFGIKTKQRNITWELPASPKKVKKQIQSDQFSSYDYTQNIAPFQEGHRFFEQAQIYSRNTNFEQAIECFLKSKQLFGRVKDNSATIALIECELGFVYYQVREYDASIKSLQKSYELFSANYLENEQKLMIVVDRLIVVYFQTRNIPKYVSYCKVNLEMIQLACPPQDYVTFALTFIQNCVHFKTYDPVLPIALKVEAFYSKSSHFINNFNMAKVYEFSAFCLIQLAKYQEAFKTYRKQFQILQKMQRNGQLERKVLEERVAHFLGVVNFIANLPLEKTAHIRAEVIRIANDFLPNHKETIQSSLCT